MADFNLYFRGRMYEIIEFEDFDNFAVKVPSSSNPGTEHIVSRVAGINHCTCPGFEWYGYCHHFSDLLRDPILNELRDKVTVLKNQTKQLNRELRKRKK